MKRILLFFILAVMLSGCEGYTTDFENDFAEMTTREPETEMTTLSYQTKAKTLSDGSKEYKGEYYKLTLPPQWIKKDQKPAYLYFICFDENNETKEYADATISLMIDAIKEKVETEEDMDNYNKENLEEFQSLYQSHDIKDLEEEKVEINGHTGYFRSYAMYSESSFQDLYYIQYLTALGNRVFMITFTSLEKDFYGAHFEEFKNIVSTFEISAEKG